VEPRTPSGCGCLHLRFTAEVIEVVGRRGEECKDTVLLQWPLEQINLLGVYSNIDKPEVSLHIYLLKAKAALQKCKSVYDASLRQWEFLDGKLGGREEGQTNSIKIRKLSPYLFKLECFFKMQCFIKINLSGFSSIWKSLSILYSGYFMSVSWKFPKSDWLFVCIGLLNIALR
jgi:hypothetical protein